LLSAIPTLGWDDVLVRLAVAAGLAGIIGLERELREREAGLRTHMLVSLGAALFTLVSAYGFEDFLNSGSQVVRTDPTRIAAQIVTGVGFLGAGAIIRHGMSVRGLTTAATLWVAAAIGMSAGAGYYSGAVLATALTLVALVPLRFVGRYAEAVAGKERTLTVKLREGGSSARLLDWLAEKDAKVKRFNTESDVVTLTFDEASPRELGEIADLDFVRGVEWHR
jgi:putative Mg2+ transporter-C (MgtC) family protein